MRFVAFALTMALVVSCGMKGSLVPPDKAATSARLPGYWMPGDEEGDFQGIKPAVADEGCEEIIESPGPIEESQAQKGTDRDEGKGTESAEPAEEPDSE